ncbi:MAG: ABC transporter permease [Chlamydiales bacterium]
MIAYIVRRILLLPLTLFVIILVNFIILNLAPGDPIHQANMSTTGEASYSSTNGGMVDENQYLTFREHYGLTLPMLFNTWPSLSRDKIHQGLDQIINAKKEGNTQNYYALKTRWGDRAKFIMAYLLNEALDNHNSFTKRQIAANLFIRGGIRQGYVGATLSSQNRIKNQKIANTNLTLSELHILEDDTIEELNRKVSQLAAWFQDKRAKTEERTDGWRKIEIFLFHTRFFRYLNRIFTLNFGTLRNDNNKTVISEVTKRVKYSLTLTLIPMLITFVLCQIFGMVMALMQNQWPDYLLNILFLILFAIPIFVAAPFLIEKIALHHTFLFTKVPMPHSGFHSPLEIYQTYTSPERLADISLHLFLPLIAVIYGNLAIQSRLSRTAFLEVLHQDHVRTARAKGLKRMRILFHHVARNGSITIITSLTASLGIVLGGSLIIETIFEINGFGRFFYVAILNRDYNVILFSAFAGSLLTLIGYFLADIAYTVLDPRISLE